MTMTKRERLAPAREARRYLSLYVDTFSPIIEKWHASEGRDVDRMRLGYLLTARGMVEDLIELAREEL